jgi:Sulfotransferase family
LRLRILNTVGKHLGAARLPVAALDEEALVQAAVKATGLTEFGDDYHREGLLRLLESVENDAALHLSGQLTFRETIVGSLINRLLLTEACKRTPEIFQRPLKPPIIVLGLPRSGTTFLHRLLAMDPAHRAVPWWELARPLPGPGSNGKSDRRRQIFQKKLRRLQKLTPDLDSKHYTRVDTPEECIWLLASTFLSPLFWALAPVYGYLDWYMSQDRLQAYYEYRLLLQVLQAADPTRRLVLKSSTHTGAVETLLQTIPGSLLIQTHRNPVETSASLASLFFSLHSRTTERLDVRRMTEAILSFHEHQIARNLGGPRRPPRLPVRRVLRSARRRSRRHRQRHLRPLRSCLVGGVRGAPELLLAAEPKRQARGTSVCSGELRTDKRYYIEAIRRIHREIRAYQPKW